jgi:hypothetical protein
MASPDDRISPNPAGTDSDLTAAAPVDRTSPNGSVPVAAAGDPPLPPMSAAQRRAFSVLSATTAPVWLAMILFPRSRATAAIVRLATPLYAALGITYTALLAGSALAPGGEAPRFDDPDQLRAALARPDAFLAGWTHYLVFDLYVGRHIWQEALSRGRADRIPLLLTWMAGPLGLTLHLARNGMDRRRHREAGADHLGR